MYRYIAETMSIIKRGQFDGVGLAHGNVVSVYPSITIAGAAPKVASHRSATKEPHIFTILLGEHRISITPGQSIGLSAEDARASETAICCSAISLTDIRLRIVPSKKSLISAGERYREHS